MFSSGSGSLRRACLLGCLLLVAACGGSQGAPGTAGGFRGTARVAIVDAFSGPSGNLGENVQNSVQAELDLLNSRGGLLGYRLEVATADDEQMPDKGAELVREQLIESDVKLLVGPSGPAVFLAARPFIDRAGIPGCTVNLSDDGLAGARFTFRAQEQDRHRLPALLAYLQRSRSEIKRIALLSDSEAPGDRYDRQLQEQAPRYGLKYLGGLAAPSTGDPKPLLQQLVQTGAQAVVVTGGPASAARIAGAIGQLGLGKQLQLLGLSGLAAYAFPQQAGDAAAGVVFEATNQSYLTGLPESRWAPPYRDFVRRITSQYGYASNGVEMLGLPAAADCVLSWSRAVQKANTFDGRPVVKAWEALDLPPRDRVLAARERPSAGDHNLLRQDGIYVYEWMKNGDRWSLRQVAGPSA